METCLNWTDGDNAYLSTDDPGVRSALLRQAEKQPEAITILARPEQNDGCLYAKVPVKFARRALKKLIPNKREPMSAERRAEVAERLLAGKAKKRVQAAASAVSAEQD